VAAAGLGTRLLPQTKAMPKEMLPLVDKPIIQYVVEELAEAGIQDVIIVTGYHKRSIEDHFDDVNTDLKASLKQSGKDELLKSLNKISTMVNFAYVRQPKGPYGSARPILNVSHLVGDEPFIYTFADDMIVAKPNRFLQMIDHYNELNGSILSCIEIHDDQDFDRYGVIAGTEVKPGVLKIGELVEKPGRENAPSNMATVSSYLLTPDVFSYVNKGLDLLKEGDEFYLTSFVLEPMIRAGLPFYGCNIVGGKYYDTGNKLGYLKTLVDFALDNQEVGDDFREYLQTLGN